MDMALGAPVVDTVGFSPVTMRAPVFMVDGTVEVTPIGISMAVPAAASADVTTAGSVLVETATALASENGSPLQSV